MPNKNKVSPKNIKSTSAQKRVLWEVRQRYHIGRPSIRGRVAAERFPANKPDNTIEVRMRRATKSQLSASPPRDRSGELSGFGSGGGKPSSKRGVGKWIRRIILMLIMVLVLSGGVFGYKVLSASNKISTTDRSLLGQLKDLFFNQDNMLAGEEVGRINVLLAAIGGEGHKGQNLADTIMVFSIRPADNKVALLSIPRDLYVKVPEEEYYSKINAVHAYGESQKKDHGPEVLTQIVEEITGQPIHYFVRIDFTAFKQIVDTVGGVDITIENSFEDYWHKISFSSGTEKMDGERALAYVRARYVEGPEGGDFKRAARQQQILLALQDKVFSVNTALDFSALNSILDSLSSNIRTDMQLWEMKKFYELARRIDREQVNSEVLTTGPNGVLVGVTEVLGGEPASVLKPRTGDYLEIREIAANIFSSSEVLPTTGNMPAPTEAAVAEKDEARLTTVEIRNGTNTTGLAGRTGDKLDAASYEVVKISNAATKSITSTTVYVLADGLTVAAEKLSSQLSAITESGLPAGETNSDAELVVILGADYNE